MTQIKVDLDQNNFSSLVFVKKNTPNHIRPLKVVSLFAGIGGFDLAFEQVGFEVIWANEIDKFACQTYRANFPNHTLIERDIKEIDVKEIPPHDILTAGFPCQPFSHAGKQKGLEDERGNLFLEIIRVLEFHKPSWFLLENVKGLTNKTNKEVFSLILSSLENCGYKVQWKVLNAKDFGVPQNRERVFIIGNRLGIDFVFPEPNQPIMTLKEALKDVPNSVGQEYSIKKKEVLAVVPAGGNWRNLPKDIAKEYMGKDFEDDKGGKVGTAYRLSWNKPSLTLMASPQQKRTERCHPSETRPLTVREYARIQTFPDNFEFKGSVSNQYKQIGNAVPPKMIKTLGLKLADILEKEVDEKYFLSEKAWRGMLNHKKKNQQKGNGFGYSLFTPESSQVNTLRARYYKDGSEILLFQYRRSYIRENKENISPTLTGNMGTGGNNVPFVILPKEKWKEQSLGIIFCGHVDKPIRKNGVNAITTHLSRTHKQQNRIHSTNGIHPTLSAQEIQGRNWVYDGKSEVRKLTPRECLRLMGFPNDFKIVVSDSQMYKQAGNSVVVPLIKELARNILDKIC